MKIGWVEGTGPEVSWIGLPYEALCRILWLVVLVAKAVGGGAEGELGVDAERPRSVDRGEEHVTGTLEALLLTQIGVQARPHASRRLDGGFGVDAVARPRPLGARLELLRIERRRQRL